MIEEHAAEFNHVNVATAFRKLLQAPRDELAPHLLSATFAVNILAR